MLKVGITGGIGSGKTLVCTVFQQLGVPVFNADDVSRKILNSDPEVVRQVKILAGQNAYTPEGSANRAHIAQVVFSDTDKLQKLNGILHPSVLKAFDAWTAQHALAAYVIKEAAIMFESGSDKGLDKIITVSCPLNLRIKRAISRNQLTEQQVLDRIKNQWPEDELIKRSTSVLMNDEKQLLIPQILKLHKEFSN